MSKLDTLKKAREIELKMLAEAKSQFEIDAHTAWIAELDRDIAKIS